MALTAALKNQESSGKPTMTGYIGRTQGGDGLPAIPHARNEGAIKDTEGSESRAKSKLSDLPLDKLDSLVDGTELMGPDALEQLKDDRDIPPRERKPHALSDSEDEHDVRIKQMAEDARVNRQKVTLKDLEGKETRPPGRPTLMTEKRAEADGRRSKDPETDRGMERIKKKAARTKGASALAMVSEVTSPHRPISSVQASQPPATASMLDGAGRETDAAINRIFHGQTVDYELAEVHDKFVYEEFKGDKTLHQPRTDLSVHLPESEKK